MDIEMMKGALFVHMVEFAQQQLGASEAEGVISKLHLKSRAAYTTVGMYPFAEFVALQRAFADRVGVDSEEFVRLFGRHTLPALMAGQDHGTSMHPFDFLERVHGVIHRDVRKLYRDANPPNVQVIEREGDECLTLRYSSGRPLAAFCEGMLEATLETFGRSAEYKVERIDPAPRRDTFAEFRVWRHPVGGG
ncbi:MAG: heme NO-binding domain-containing protein [bacterium]|nr:heme NO-binding domain-containing protein [bacterium]